MWQIARLMLSPGTLVVAVDWEFVGGVAFVVNTGGG